MDICVSCMITGAKNFTLKASETEFYQYLVGSPIEQLKEKTTMSVCLECNALLKKLLRFAQTSRSVYSILNEFIAVDQLNNSKLIEAKRKEMNLSTCLSVKNLDPLSLGEMLEVDVKPENFEDYDDHLLEPENIVEVYVEPNKSQNDEKFIQNSSLEIQNSNKETKKRSSITRDAKSKTRDAKSKSRDAKSKSRDAKSKTRDMKSKVTDEGSDDDFLDGELLVFSKPAKFKKKNIEKVGQGLIGRETKKSVYRRELRKVVNIVAFTQEGMSEEMAKRRSAMLKSVSSYKCELCCKAFREARTYQNHWMLHHDVTVGPYSCDLCHIRRPTRKALQTHIHTSHMYIYVCKTCGFETPRSSHVWKHKAFHDGKLYICDKCGQISRHMNAYYAHIRRMHREMNYPCTECGEIFDSEFGLTVHRNKNKKCRRDKNGGAVFEDCDIEDGNKPEKASQPEMGFCPG